MAQGSEQPIRLLLVDDHSLFRESLSRLLASEQGLQMVASCAGTAEALDVLNRSAVDVILLDFDLGLENGNAFLAALRRGAYPLRVLMVTAGMDAAQASLALDLGASGIFHKHNAPASLTDAIRKVNGGETWLDPALLQTLGKKSVRADNGGLRRGLTEREQFVLHRLFEGKSSKEIAGELSISESAVKATLQQLFQKTGVRTRSQLVRFALESSLGVKLKL